MRVLEFLLPRGKIKFCLLQQAARAAYTILEAYVCVCMYVLAYLHTRTKAMRFALKFRNNNKANVRTFCMCLLVFHATYQ